jgi:hypothetical protein
MPEVEEEEEEGCPTGTPRDPRDDYPVPTIICCLFKDPKQWSQPIMDWNFQNLSQKCTFSLYKLIISDILP